MDFVQVQTANSVIPLEGNRTKICQQSDLARALFQRIQVNSTIVMIKIMLPPRSSPPSDSGTNALLRLLVQYRALLPDNISVESTTTPGCGGVVYLVDSDLQHHYANMLGASGQVTMNSTVNITSPRYPDNYQSRLLCRWTIIALPSTKRIQFDLLDMKIESHLSGYSPNS